MSVYHIDLRNGMMSYLICNGMIFVFSESVLEPPKILKTTIKDSYRILPVKWYLKIINITSSDYCIFWSYDSKTIEFDAVSSIFQPFNGGH